MECVKGSQSAVSKKLFKYQKSMITIKEKIWTDQSVRIENSKQYVLKIENVQKQIKCINSSRTVSKKGKKKVQHAPKHILGILNLTYSGLKRSAGTFIHRERTRRDRSLPQVRCTLRFWTLLPSIENRADDKIIFGIIMHLTEESWNQLDVEYWFSFVMSLV